MLDKLKTSSRERVLIIYVFLAAITLAVFWQVNQYGFVFDDTAYVTDNSHIQSGITLKGIFWAFSTKYFGLWHPMVWLSLMLDYQLFGLNAGGYHWTNVIIHILSTLLLFGLFHRMTGAVWKSAFVAAFFAIHPLHVESVAWISERKDVLSTFFWILTLCMYTYYTKKPTVRRYWGVFCCFILALMSKPMVVTLPLVMILLDYWPLRRFESKKGKLILWQLKEKTVFFILSAILIIITLYNTDAHSIITNPDFKHFHLSSRIANALVSFVIYLVKTFWPYNLAILYPFPADILVWQITGASLLIIILTTVILMLAKRLPYLFVGWAWFVITIFPVIGIIQISFLTPYAMADRYHYLSSVGIAMMLAFGLPLFFQNKVTRKKVLFPVAVAFLAVLAVLSWKQCGYWKNDIEVFHHALQVTKDNYVAHNNLGRSLFFKGKLQEAVAHYNKAIEITNNYYAAYINRGNAYASLGEYQRAIADYNKAVSINKKFYTAYYNRGNAYANYGQYTNAVEDYNTTIYLNPDYADAYFNRAYTYNKIAQYQNAINDYSKTIQMKPSHREAYSNRGNVYARLGQYRSAIADYNKSISLNPRDMQTYFNRVHAYLNSGDVIAGCRDAQKNCELGECRLLEWAKLKGYCH